jgi:rod shape-determining protein MreC
VRRDTLAFIGCIVLAIAARLAPADVQARVASGIRSTVALPFLALEQQAVLLKASRLQLSRVTAERDAALVEALRARELEDENAELRRLLGLSARLGTSHISATILHQAGLAEGLTFLLSAGSRRGVVPRAPVVGVEGLIGVVLTVDPETSIAMGWPHPDFRVSAMTPDGSVFGIVAPLGTSGPNTMLLELRGVPYGERVPTGTPIVTSGLGGAGGVYPRGIPVGTVLDVAAEQEGWSRTYRVRPAVHPASVSQVVILTGQRLDLTGAFTAPTVP